MDTYNLDFYLHVNNNLNNVFEPFSLVQKHDRTLIYDLQKAENQRSSISVELDKNWFNSNDWINGSFGIKYDKLKYATNHNTLAATPVVTTGFYSQEGYDLPLFSDYSGSLILDPNNVSSGFGFFPLFDDIKSHYIAVYKRDETLKAIPYYIWNEVDVFTGAYIEGSRNTVLTAADADPNVFEFRVDTNSNKIQLNQFSIFKVGSLRDYDPVLNPIDSILDTWEYKGFFEGDRKCWTSFFPVVGNIKVYQIEGLVATEIPQVEHLYDLGSEVGFILHRASGLLEFSGEVFTPVFLSQNIDASQTDISIVLPEFTKLEDCPFQGLITIDSEIIKFNGRAGFYLLNCERGYSATTSATHTAGSIVSFHDFGMPVTGDIYISYEYGPRLDFEITSNSERTCNHNSWLDLNKFATGLDNGIVVLNTDVKNVASLELSLDATLIENNTYGGVVYGDLNRLVQVDAYDRLGNKVAGLPIEILLTSGYGLIDNSVYTNRITNNNGQAFATYSAPLDDNVYVRPSSIVYDTTTTFSSSSIIGNESLNSIYLFHGLKHDPFNGTVGLSNAVRDEPQVSSILSSYYIDLINPALDTNYDEGRFYIKDSNDVAYVRTIVTTRIMDDGAGDRWTRIFFEEELDLAGGTIAGLPVWFLRKEEIDYTINNNVKVLVYKHDGSQYVPVHPTSITAGEVVFDEALPEASSTNMSNNIGEYYLLFNRIATLEATATDPATGRTIVSNQITVLLTFSDSILGEEVGLTIEGQQSSSISPANWITLNYRVTGLNRINIFGNIP